MKKYFLIAVIGILSLGMTMTSCSKDDDDAPAVDVRDKYVGTWNSKEIGSLTLYSAGAAIGTVPIDETSTVNVSKSGDKGLTIDGRLFIVNDNRLSSDPESMNETDDGVNIVGTITNSGQLASNLITINGSVTGTWSHSSGTSGNLSGTTITSLTK